MATLVNNTKNTEQQNAQGQTVPPPGASGPAFAGAGATQSTPAASGRFVNTQQFLNANKGAGQQIGGAIQSGISGQLKKEESAVGKEAENVRSGIASAQGNIQQGGQIYGQLGGDASKYNVAQPVQKLGTEDLVSMANDANKLKQVTDYRTGATAQQDITNLGNLNTSYADRAAAANVALQQRQQQLQGETNRFGLLNEFVGQKNNYGQGAQRLDQAFLQRDKSGALNNLQQNLKGQTDVFGKLVKQGDVFKGQASDVGTQAQNLSKDIGTQTGAVESGYLSDIGSKVGDVNAQRDAERQQYKDFLDIMKGTKQGQVANPVWSDFGLADNMNAYNTFNNIGDINEIANISAQQAKDYHDVASQKNVEQYGALAKLAGLDNSKLNAAGNLETAAKAKEASDPNSLLNRIINSYNSMLDTAKNTNLTGTGIESYNDNWGRSGESRDYASQNMGELLQNAGIDTSKHAANIKGFDSTQYTPANVVRQDLTAGMQSIPDIANGNLNADNLYNTAMMPVGGAATQSAIGDVSRNISGAIQNAVGARDNAAGARGAATTKAYEKLNEQINAWKQQQGLQNVVTRSGVKNRDDVGNFVNTMKMMNGGAV